MWECSIFYLGCPDEIAAFLYLGIFFLSLLSPKLAQPLGIVFYEARGECPIGHGVPIKLISSNSQRVYLPTHFSYAIRIVLTFNRKVITPPTLIILSYFQAKSNILCCASQNFSTLWVFIIRSCTSSVFLGVGGWVSMLFNALKPEGLSNNKLTIKFLFVSDIDIPSF